MCLRALLVDFNSYFASVEQQLRPELRGKPLAVAPVLTDSTCCIAASYEAKKFGIKTGTRISLARRICPELEVVEARPQIYVEMHHKLVAVVESCIHVEEILSIDEMRCELTGALRQREHAEALAFHIKKSIAEKIGAHLRSSIGIAPNAFLAKAASDMQKPDGLVVIEKPMLPDCLFKMELRDFCGIGPRMERRLRAAGIHTVEALCAAPRGQLRGIWGGVEGERMHLALRGEPVQRAPTRKRMLGHSHVLAPEQRHDPDALAVLHRLLQKAAMRLRAMNLLTSGMQLFIEYAQIGGYCEEVRFLETCDTIELLRVLRELWERRPRAGKPPIMVGVDLLNLVEENNYTPSLFQPARTEISIGESEARRDLFARVDALNRRFGKNAVYFGGSHNALKSAPMRIAFNRIPDLETEE